MTEERQDEKRWLLATIDHLKTKICLLEMNKQLDTIAAERDRLQSALMVHQIGFPVKGCDCGACATIVDLREQLAKAQAGFKALHEAVALGQEKRDADLEELRQERDLARQELELVRKQRDHAVAMEANQRMIANQLREHVGLHIQMHDNSRGFPK